jgi:hypothetical protein
MKLSNRGLLLIAVICASLALWIAIILLLAKLLSLPA